MPKIVFSGEESPRFVRFSELCTKVGIDFIILVIGRDPVTARTVNLIGRVKSSVSDGYLRHLVVRDDSSCIDYWVAGSNSTRSIAAISVEFQIAEDEFLKLKWHCEQNSILIPGVPSKSNRISEEIDLAIRSKSPEALAFLLEIIVNHKGKSQPVLFEAITALRAYASLITPSRQFQFRSEECTIKAIDEIYDRECRIRLIENLGYFGSKSSVMKLSQFISDVNADYHVRWAASIALSRIAGDDIYEYLAPGLKSGFAWLDAACLLGLARRASEKNRFQLEPLFRKFLTSGVDKTLKRYACFGLSRFDNLSKESHHALLGILGDTVSSVDLFGYAALALSSCISSFEYDFIDQLRDKVFSISEREDLCPVEPEEIWGLEFVAELASLLEMNSASARFHERLAQVFDGWQSQYYLSVHFYQIAEADVAENRPYEAAEAFQKAHDLLPPEIGLPRDAHYTISFRRSIVDARLALNEVISSWRETFDIAGLKRLEASLEHASSIYACYVNPPVGREGVKQLSERELAYIRSIRRLVNILCQLIELDIAARNTSGTTPGIQRQVEIVSESLQILEDKFSVNITGSLHFFVQEAASRFAQFTDLFSNAGQMHGDQIRGLRALLMELKTILAKTTWPIPARACPVGGLGKGSLYVVSDDPISGNGSQGTPYLFPNRGKAILSIIADIDEMAPGLSNNVRVVCNVLGSKISVPVYVVEGPYPCQFDLDEFLAIHTYTRCKFDLEFHARDCHQIACSIVVYVQRRAI